MNQTAVRKPALSRRRFLLGCGAAGAVGAWAYLSQGRHTPVQSFTRSSAALGSSVSMTVLHADPTLAERSLDAAFAELARVERVMSLYQPDSELCRLNRDGAIRDPDPYLVQVLREALRMSEQSNGAFDPTVQPIWNAYASAKRAGRTPTDAELTAAVRSSDWRRVSVTDREIRLHDRGMAITLNGIAQGFAADRAMEALKREGVEHALVNAGEIASLGRKEVDAWRVGIQHPRVKDAYIGVASLDGRCLSTSGDYETVFSDDLSSHHIVDPATGRSPHAMSSVSVAAPSATLADALSTAIFVLGPEKGLALAQQSDRTDVLLVLADGQTLATRGFPLEPTKETQHVES